MIEMHHFKNVVIFIQRILSFVLFLLNSLLHKFQNIFLRSALLTIYKCFVRTHLDYGNIIYGQAFDNSSHQKNESLQYNAALAITGALRGTLREKNCQELGLKSLQEGHWSENNVAFSRYIKTNAEKNFLI